MTSFLSNVFLILLLLKKTIAWEIFPTYARFQSVLYMAGCLTKHVARVHIAAVILLLGVLRNRELDRQGQRALNEMLVHLKINNKTFQDKVP